jgi:hypothetical protein
MKTSFRNLKMTNIHLIESGDLQPMVQMFFIDDRGLKHAALLPLSVYAAPANPKENSNGCQD